MLRILAVPQNVDGLFSERHFESGDRQLERGVDGSPAQSTLHPPLHLLARQEVEHQLGRGEEIQFKEVVVNESMFMCNDRFLV